MSHDMLDVEEMYRETRNSWLKAPHYVLPKTVAMPSGQIPEVWLPSHPWLFAPKETDLHDGLLVESEHPKTINPVFPSFLPAPRITRHAAPTWEEGKAAWVRPTGMISRWFARE